MNHIIKQIWSLLLIGAVVASCNDWNDHYDRSEMDNSTLNLYEMLASNPQTTTFASLVTATGYDDILKSTQTYTVFAPSNESLSTIDIKDAEQVRHLVSNHIARYSNPSSTGSDVNVRMVNGKIYHFGSNNSFGGQSIIQADNRASNGILHLLGGNIPYAFNLYEYIQNTSACSKLYDFIHRFDEIRMDEERSTETGIDEQGRPVYDTIQVHYNRLLQDKTYGLGSIASEDSIYTMLIPDNTAWDAAYQRISPFFINYGTDKKVTDSIQDVRTGLAIVNDLIYKGNHPQPILEDSLISSSGSIIHNTSELFSPAIKTSVSNGLGFATSILNYDNTETWNKPISIEGEEQNGRTYNNTLTGVFTETTTSANTIENISGDSYIEVRPMSTSNNPTVIFDIPGVLAGTYNVYAVFLPSTVQGVDEERDSTKIIFTLQYLSDNGRIQSKTNRDAANLTNSQEVTKMLAFEDFTFPVSDCTDNLWLMDENHSGTSVTTHTTLSIATNVTTREYTQKKYSRTYRLDRIILEPVKK